MDEENREIVVLGMVSRSISKFGKISQETKIEPKELELILQKLEKSGLIRVDEKKGWLSTKIDIRPTEEGYREFERQLKILQEKWDQLENTYKSGNKQELEQKLKEDKSFLPSMMMFGIIDMMMFSMMFSVIGTSMGSFIPAGDMENSDFGDDGRFDMDIGF
jgi:DNA-binding PadR family transcriptional regulator|tara:strand:- start:5705 stop:6190 length:486 start_codon:yes stop_codon:yes gene_type:complete